MTGRPGNRGYERPSTGFGPAGLWAHDVVGRTRYSRVHFFLTQGERLRFLLSSEAEVSKREESGLPGTPCEEPRMCMRCLVYLYILCRGYERAIAHVVDQRETLALRFDSPCDFPRRFSGFVAHGSVGDIRSIDSNTLAKREPREAAWPWRIGVLQ